MKGFIEVHLNNSDLKVSMNIDNIVSFYKDEDVDGNEITSIIPSPDDYLEVKENYDEVKTLIEEAME